MIDLVVTRLTPDLWRRQRDIRLASLAQAPEAFGSTLAREQVFGEDVWRTRAARPATWLVARDGTDVGIGGVYETDRIWSVNGMYVAPSARGTGVIEALMAAIDDHVVAVGATTVRLLVMADNARGIAAYTRLGYLATGEREVAPDGREELAMVKDLAAQR